MDKLGLRELLRYGYAGFLCALVAALVDGPNTEKLVNNLGPVLSPFVALAVGTVVYLVFKALVVDRYLSEAVHWSHTTEWRPFRWFYTTTPACFRCKLRYLENEFGLPRKLCPEAYVCVRDHRLKDDLRERYHTQHSEAYVFYLTTFICLPTSVLFICVLPWAVSLGLAAASLVTLLAGLFHDAFLCKAERDQISMLPDLDETLRKAGFPATKRTNDKSTSNMGTWNTWNMGSTLDT